jgi:hypothetical protein
MAAQQEPIRIIYAKLTSTGAYDVVAKTPNIDVPAARDIAEKIQLGNLPFGVRVGEEFGYARPAANEHIIARYTTYGWSDGRSAPLMTDLVHIDDANFRRVRCNPFALIPHSDDVFAELTELPAIQITDVTAEQELARLRELAPAATDFTTFVAGVLAADSLLLIAQNNQLANLELLTLLLPPRLRERVTFQTTAFQPPQVRRRITIADAMHASLRAASWTRVLPEEADALTLNPANRFTEFLAAPERLQRAHALYERIAATDVSASLATEAARLVRFADFQSLLERKLVTEALRVVAKGTGSEVAVELQELTARFPAEGIAEALVALFETGADDATLTRLLQEMSGSQMASAAYGALTHAVLSSRRTASPELLAALLAQIGGRDLDRALRMFAIAREASPTARIALPEPLASYAAAQAGSAQTRPLERAAALVRTGATMYDRLQTPEARAQIEADCRSAVNEAVRNVVLSVADIRALRALQTELDGLSFGWSSELGTVVVSDDAVERASAKQLEERGKHIGESSAPEWAGTLCATLLVRIAQAPLATARTKFAAVAHALLAAHADSRLGTRVAALLAQLGVSDGDLLEEPAFSKVLPFLGDTAREASLGQSIGGALTRLFNDGAGAAAELASIVFMTRSTQQHVTVGSRAYNAVISALRTARDRGLIAQQPVQAELALDLLAFATDPATFREIENTALGRSDGMPVRLRRLDRAVAQATTANDEQLYSALATALESDSTAIDPAARRRLREVLGTSGLHRRLLDAFNTVVQRSVQ